MYEKILVTLEATPTDRAIIEHVKTLATGWLDTKTCIRHRISCYCLLSAFVMRKDRFPSLADRYQGIVIAISFYYAPLGAVLRLAAPPVVQVVRCQGHGRCLPR